MSGLQIQTTQNPHTQVATTPSTNLHGFGDIKVHVQQTQLNQAQLMEEIEASRRTMEEHVQANEELRKANEKL